MDTIILLPLGAKEFYARVSAACGEIEGESCVVELPLGSSCRTIRSDEKSKAPWDTPNRHRRGSELDRSGGPVGSSLAVRSFHFLRRLLSLASRLPVSRSVAGALLCGYSMLAGRKASRHGERKDFDFLRTFLGHRNIVRDTRVLLVDPPDRFLRCLPFLLLTGDLPRNRTAILETEKVDGDGHSAPGLQRQRLLARLQRLRATAPPVFGSDSSRALPPALVDWLRCPIDESPNPPPVALLVAQSDLLGIAAGSITVIEQQVEYLAERGFATIVLAVAPLHIPRYRLAPGEARRLAHWPILAHAETVLAPGLSDFRRMCALAAAGGRKVERPMRLSLEGHRLQKVPGEIQAVVAAGAVRVALLNYFWTLPLVEKLGFDGPVICETHDVQSIQRAHHLGRSVSEEDLQAELGALNRVDAIVAISDAEARFFEKRLSGPKVHYIVPGYELRIPDDGPISKCASLDEVCAASGAKRRVRARADKLDGPLDLLFVASHNEHNLAGLLWLVDEVLPKLGSDVRLVVAGSVAELLGREAERLDADPQIRILGRVADLEPLYAAARVVTVPLRSGEGTSIKTLEAMSYGKPVIATAKGLRGLGEVSYPHADDAETFARTVAGCLENEETRAALAGKAWQVAIERFTLAEHDRRMDELFISLQIHLGDGTGTVPKPAPVFAHVEWRRAARKSADGRRHYPKSRSLPSLISAVCRRAEERRMN